MAGPDVKPSGHYSGSNPIPNIKQFVERMDKDKAERDRQIDQAAKSKQPMPHVETKAGKPGTRRTVHDPTTGGNVDIEDVDKKHLDFVKNPTLSVPNANLEGKEVPLQTKSTQSGEDYKRTQDVLAPPDPIHPNSTSDVPIHGEKTNILFHPTPSVSYEPMYEALEKRTYIVIGGVFAAIVIFGKVFGASLLGLIPTAACVASGIWLWMKEVVRSGREVEWASEQKRGEYATQNLIPESVEWMNTLMAVIWGLINPEMFAGVADTIEDVMQASLPGVIENVRVADISQGSNPFRVLSMRALPDDSVKELKDAIHEENAKVKDPQEVAADEEGGDYYNMEIAFAYHAKPSGSGVSSKARNMHMNIVFYLGVKGLFGVPLPIWVELQGLVGTIRLRMQMTPEAPFLKTLTFTMMGIPQVQVGCVPMFKTGVNILNLPLISNFVQWAIGAACSMYVAPKCMTLDVGKMLQGDDITKETEALGVIFVKIHGAKGLSKQDRRGSKEGGSDPYITLSFSKYGKPMYCTRVIQDDLNPIWEEHAGLLLKADYIKADENLSVELWDSDRMSADDVVGKIELSLQEMIAKPGTMFKQESKLRGIKAESTMPGVLYWEVGYFEKPQFRASLRTSGKNVNVQEHLQNKEEFQDDKGVLENAEEDAVAHTPPDPLWPSGILSVIVHQIVSLELDNIKGSDGNRKGKEYEPGKNADEVNEEEGQNLPSSYCTIHLNDALIYRTRVKVVSSQPIFNAGTERWIRDWRSAIATVTVRDQRMRQHDPILGVVPLRLADILQTSSQVTRWYPLDGGIGFGRVRISLLFRSVETRLPANLLGWDVGTVEFKSAKIEAVGYNKSSSIKCHTGGSSGKFSRSLCESSATGAAWQTKQKDGTAIRFPVKYRYRSPLVFEFTPSTSRKPDGYAMLWLQHLVDNEVTDIDLPIWSTKNPARLLHNYITEENIRSVTGVDDIKELGRLKFKARFSAGIDEDHAHFVTDNDSRETQEMWDACRAEGVREPNVTAELPPDVQRLHEESLVKERDVLLKMSLEERSKWLTKDGTDWIQAFGDDPAAIADEYLRRKTQRGTRAGKATDRDADDDDDADDSDDSDYSGLHEVETIEEDKQPGRQAGHDGSENRPSGTDGVPSQENANPEAGYSVHNGKPKSGPFKEYRDNKDGLHRKQRGLMQWKPARNARFALNEAKFAVKGLKNKLSLDGREPDVETEA